jgi:hypothetical protein
MGRKIGRTNALYGEQPWHSHAHADCYRCGTRERASRMHWLPHQQSGVTFALCRTCHATHGSRYAALNRDHESSSAPGT